MSHIYASIIQLIDYLQHNIFYVVTIFIVGAILARKLGLFISKFLSEKYLNKFFEDETED